MPRPSKRVRLAKKREDNTGRFSGASASGPAHTATPIDDDSTLPDLVEVSDSSDDELGDSGDDEESSWSDTEETCLNGGRLRNMDRVPTRAETRQERAKRRETANLETHFAGPKDKTGQARGVYTGQSERTERDHRKQLNAARRLNREAPIAPAFQAWVLRRGSGVPDASRPARAAPSQAPLPSARTARAAAPSPEPVPIDVDVTATTPPAHPAEVDEVDNKYDVMLRMLDSEPESTEEQANAHAPDGPDRTIDPAPASAAETEQSAAQEQGEALTQELLDVVDEELPRSLLDCRALAEEGLSNFYAKVPHLGCMRASLLVAKNFVRGPHCARSIRSDARHFEKHGQLPPPRRSKVKASGSLLDDEAVYMGVQRWLRCQETGKVRPGSFGTQNADTRR